MTADTDRRRMMQLSLAALPALMLGQAGTALAAHAAHVEQPMAGGTGSSHDFDFFLGEWRVEHRRLKKRLVGSDDWEKFSGSTRCVPLLGGVANLNDSIVQRPDGVYRGLGLRAFDAKTRLWADWYLSERDATHIGAPGIGRFADGIGTFLSDETFEGRPVKVRGIFSSLSPDLAQWEQAFSADSGKTWETNWVMRYLRTA